MSRIQFTRMFLSVILGISPLWASIEEGDVVHGFTLIEKRFVQEVNAECLLFEHKQSGARLFKIAADDPNKTFCISFKTITESDAGTPHILEHSVLNGSKNFPVKSPFDILSKGSLNTFLNAMTGSDVTFYPVASMNDKDFQNLMHVYLDAVFNPLIYDDSRIFSQEGWHRELEHADSSLSYKGVVYNEMRGAFSSPERELYYQTLKNLFPDSPYRFSSGGYPSAIPSLTYDAFLDFHRTHYHPSNAYIFLYGDSDLDKDLAFIDAEYLSGYQRSDAVITIKDQQPFEAPREVSAYYPVPENSDINDKTYLAMSYVAGNVTDQKLFFGLQILWNVLVNNESAVLRLALQDAGIGKNISGVVDDIKQPVFQVRVQNANPEYKDRFRDIIYSSLRHVVADGLDREAVEGALNRMEFRLREGNNAQKGLNYTFRIMTGWLWSDDPFAGLEFEAVLADLRNAISEGYLESVIQKYFLDNPHALLLVLEPKPGMEKENAEKIAAELAQYKTGLSKNEIQALVKETETLIAHQKQDDSPEAVATIPMLDLEDINPEAGWYEVKKKKTGGVPYLHYETFSNNVIYTRFYFDLRVLPQDLLPYASLLSNLLGALNTNNYDFGSLEKAMNLHIGGYNTFLTSFLESRDDNQLIPMFVVSAKALNTKLDKLFELMGELVNETRFDDTDRLKDVLTRHQSQLESRVKRDGLGVAHTRLTSYYSNLGKYNEITKGLDYFWFVTNLLNGFGNNYSLLVEKLEQVAGLLFTKDNLLASVTCSSDDIRGYRKGLKKFSRSLKRQKPTYQKWIFELEPKNEGLLAAVKVQYVLKGYDFKKLGYDWDGRFRVLNQIISREWLRNQVRVIGGAYGGFSSFTSNGQVYFGSYRDPNLAMTLDNYDAIPEFLAAFDADKAEMARFIIGTIARMDRPLTPSQEGNLAVQYYLEKTSRSAVQKERDAVLAARPENIREMSQMVSDILNRNVICVYGNEEKLKTQSHLFETLFNPLDISE